MSWVALAKAMSMKTAKEPCSQKSVGKVKATSAKATPMKNCIDTIHQRFVLRLSIMGLQIGLMTHGKPSQPV